MTTIFESKDGKQFANEEEAKAYEYKLTLLEASRDLIAKIYDFIPLANDDERREAFLLKKFLDEETKKYKQDS